MLKNTKLLKAHGYINGEWVGDNTESRFDLRLLMLIQMK